VQFAVNPSLILTCSVGFVSKEVLVHLNVTRDTDKGDKKLSKVNM